MELPGRKTSSVWDYFTIFKDPKFIVCQACNKKASCGGKNCRVIYVTKNLMQHLRAKHTQLHKEFQQKIEVQNAVTSSTSPAPFQQKSLRQSGDHVQIWDINDAHAQRIPRKMGEMIALDCELFFVA